jgi:hypothetical protein
MPMVERCRLHLEKGRWKASPRKHWRGARDRLCDRTLDRSVAGRGLYLFPESKWCAGGHYARREEEGRTIFSTMSSTANTVTRGHVGAFVDVLPQVPARAMFDVRPVCPARRRTRAHVVAQGYGLRLVFSRRAPAHGSSGVAHSRAPVSALRTGPRRRVEIRRACPCLRRRQSASSFAARFAFVPVLELTEVRLNCMVPTFNAASSDVTVRSKALPRAIGCSGNAHPHRAPSKYRRPRNGSCSNTQQGRGLCKGCPPPPRNTACLNGIITGKLEDNLTI